MAQPSSGVVVVVSVSVVLDFQRAIIQYIKSSAGKQVRIFTIRGRTRVIPSVHNPVVPVDTACMLFTEQTASAHPAIAQSAPPNDIFLA